MWTFTLRDVLLIIAVTLLTAFRLVTSHCSEAHRQTCSWSYIQLQLINSRLPLSTRHVPDYNETSLGNVCNLYSEYRDCTQPFLSSCNQQTISELQTYDVALGLICDDLFNAYLAHRSCYQLLQASHSTCKQKEIAAIQNIDITNSAYKYLLCSSSREYVLCIYTATALGCSMQAADVYFKLLNHSISSLFTNHDYSCKIDHPMDVISIYTTTPSTLPVTSQSAVTEKKHDIPKSSKETSGCLTLSRTRHYGIYILFPVVIRLLSKFPVQIS